MGDVCVDFKHPADAHPIIIDAEQAIIDWRGRRKFGIIGFATSSRDQAPFNDPAWILIGLSQLYRHIPRADAWADIHVNWNEHVVEGTDHAAWIKAAQIPVFMKDRNPEFPNSVRYPIERILKYVGIDYFTSTIAFLIALGMEQGFESIGLWGIDLAVGTEWVSQRPCAEFLLGMAHAKGIEVVLPAETALLKQHFRYGYELEVPGLIKRSMLEKRGELIDKERHAALMRLANLDGAKAERDYWMQVYELRERNAQVGE
jgi:hypothetical protein